MGVFVTGANAHPGHWAASDGQAWETGFGDCWSASSGDIGSNCVEAEEETETVNWSDDQDRDGVVDAEDRCPSTPEGIEVDAEGCALDSDGDGVPDYLDKCPGTPAGTVVDTDGCGLSLVTLRGVHFAFDSATLTSEAKSILDGALAAINANASQNLSVEGHTDSTGDDAYNQGLSQKRAQAVVDYLVSKGVSGDRLTATGYGESKPAHSNDTSSSRAQNRRVEILAK